MLRLYILRHAKSSWALPGRSDFDRGLNGRGTKDLARIARAMTKHNYLPDQIYCSSSNRTRLTIDGIVPLIPGFSPAIEYQDNLYSGPLDNYLAALQSHPDKTSSLMIVGHNPTCDTLASFLIGDGQEDAMKIISYKYPTGALAVIDMDVAGWGDIAENTGYLRDFLIPKDL